MKNASLEWEEVYAATLRHTLKEEIQPPSGTVDKAVIFDVDVKGGLH